MSEKSLNKPDEQANKESGFLVLRLRPGEGFWVGDCEVHVGAINDRPTGKVSVAIKAPREIRIKKLK